MANVHNRVRNCQIDKCGAVRVQFNWQRERTSCKIVAIERVAAGYGCVICTFLRGSFRLSPLSVGGSASLFHCHRPLSLCCRSLVVDHHLAQRWICNSCNSSEFFIRLLGFSFKFSTFLFGFVSVCTIKKNPNEKRNKQIARELRMAQRRRKTSAQCTHTTARKFNWKIQFQVEFGHAIPDMDYRGSFIARRVEEKL